MNSLFAAYVVLSETPDKMMYEKAIEQKHTTPKLFYRQLGEKACRLMVFQRLLLLS